jgi:ribose-phosphate pyrophosphokinase
MIIVGSQAQDIGQGLKKELDDVFEVKYKRFPDGEIYLRLPEKANKKVLIVQRINLPYSNLMELFFLIDLVKKQGAKKITCLLPYMPHARQHQAYKKNEAVTFETILKLLSDVGVNQVVSFDVHAYRGMGQVRFGDLEIINMSLFDLLREEADKRYGKLSIIFPDQGMSKNTGWALKKTRKDAYVVDIQSTKKRFPDSVLLLDDIISTGGTAISAARYLQDQGVKHIIVGVIHGLFLGDSYSHILQYTQGILCTNTIRTRYSNIDITPKIVDFVKKWKT